MPTSKTYLPDINVWIAMAFSGHVHNLEAMHWFNMIEETVAFCRITQMGLLRLLTNRKVMGEDVLTQDQAWNNYDQLHEDPHVTFFNEPSNLEEIWRATILKRNPPHTWTDAYLLSFAKAQNLIFVTFDKALGAADSSVVVLSPRYGSSE